MASPACPGVAGIDRLEVDHRHRDPSSSSRPTPPTTVTTPPNWQCRATGCLAVDHDPTTPRRARRARARLAPGHCIPTETRSPSCGPRVKLRRQVLHTPGGLGVSMIAEPSRKTYWTLSAWTDQAALDHFVRTSPHSDAMRLLRSPARGFVVHDVACADRRATSTTHRRRATLEPGQTASRIRRPQQRTLTYGCIARLKKSDSVLARP